LFVGEVSGIDLAWPLSAETAAEIQAAIDRYAVLIFHDQPLDDDSQLAFARNFGHIEPPQSSNSVGRVERSATRHSSGEFARRVSRCSTRPTIALVTPSMP
jgi:alpha-ketoglutarate-dependent taurine dioxygenase